MGKKRYWWEDWREEGDSEGDGKIDPNQLTIMGRDPECPARVYLGTQPVDILSEGNQIYIETPQGRIDLGYQDGIWQAVPRIEVEGQDSQSDIVTERPYQPPLFPIEA